MLFGAEDTWGNPSNTPMWGAHVCPMCAQTWAQCRPAGMGPMWDMKTSPTWALHGFIVCLSWAMHGQAQCRSPHTPSIAHLHTTNYPCSPHFYTIICPCSSYFHTIICLCSSHFHTIICPCSSHFHTIICPSYFHTFIAHASLTSIPSFAHAHPTTYLL